MFFLLNSMQAHLAIRFTTIFYGWTVNTEHSWSCEAYNHFGTSKNRKCKLYVSKKREEGVGVEKNVKLTKVSMINIID